MSEAMYTLDDMTINDIIEVLQSLVFNSYGRTTPKERYAVSRAIDLIECRSVKNAEETKYLKSSTSYENFLQDIDSEPIAEMRDIKEGFGI